MKGVLGHCSPGVLGCGCFWSKPLCCAACSWPCNLLMHGRLQMSRVVIVGGNEQALHACRHFPPQERCGKCYSVLLALCSSPEVIFLLNYTGATCCRVRLVQVDNTSVLSTCCYLTFLLCYFMYYRFYYYSRLQQFSTCCKRSRMNLSCTTEYVLCRGCCCLVHTEVVVAALKEVVRMMLRCAALPCIQYVYMKFVERSKEAAAILLVLMSQQCR